MAQPNPQGLCWCIALHLAVFFVGNDYMRTGEGDETTKRYSEALMEATDRPLGAAITTFRGVGLNESLSSDKKVGSALKKIERGDFSKADVVKSALEGKIVKESGFMSTSNSYNGDYGKRPIQMVMMSPAEAKGVDITSASAYGEAQQHYSFLGTGKKESEVLFRAGVQCQINSVDFSSERQQNGKRVGKVWLTCSIIPGNQDSDDNLLVDIFDDTRIYGRADSTNLGSVGVIVLNITGEDVLCGTRSDNGLICGPGGNIQEGETPAQAAIRETQEEFGITPLNLKRVGQIKGFEGGKYGEPFIYLCTEYEGEPKASEEIRNPGFFPVDEFEPEEIGLFPPFAESLGIALKYVENLSQTGENTSSTPFSNTRQNGSIKDMQTITQTDGGPGSGRYPKGSGEENLSKVSGTGANVFQTGFSKPNLDTHFSKHKKDYPGMSKQQYENEALQLIQSKAEGNIRGYVRENGQIVRYNRTTGDLVIGNNQPNTENTMGIATMHKVKEAKYERLLKEEAFGDDSY